jgi:RimJ/RimL family protein N-acetyltransferase
MMRLLRLSLKKSTARAYARESKGAAMMRLELVRSVIRSWQEGDADSLAAHANNRKIWRNLRDAFPHPYSVADAQAFIQSARAQSPEARFAIEVDGRAVGGIGFTLGADVERVSAEVGYWLGEDYWGRGITTEALKAVTRYAAQAHRLTRIYAVPYEWNQASFRVLEKAGYTWEARLRRSAIKDGQVIDQVLFAYVVPESDREK